MPPRSLTAETAPTTALATHLAPDPTVAAGRRLVRWAVCWRDHPAIDAALPLALVATGCLAPVLGANPATSGAARAILAALAGLTVLAAAAGQHRSTRLGLALVTMLAAAALPWQVAWWPLPGLAGVGVYLAAGWLPALRDEPGLAWSRGRLGRGELAAIAAIGALAAAVLVIYQRLDPAPFHFGTGLLNQFPAWAPPLAGAGFVTGNAAVEEALFRGVIFTHLTRAIGTWPALAVQAAGFGALNLHGYPHGPVGVALTAGYGLLLGLLRLRARGLLACWIAHTLADAVIFTFIVQAATQQIN